MVRIDHVNLPVPPGGTEASARFYEQVLGFRRASRPERGRAGAWLDVGDGTQVHLTERPDGQAHPDQHVAFVVGDLAALDAALVRATDAGSSWEALGPGRAKLRDPAGNLVELFAEGTIRA